jgi:hypothetical protein
MDKITQLRMVLSQLPSKQALALAHGVELQRALRKDGLPSEPVLEGLRPLLREHKPARVPTLCRLICTGIEEFLTDATDDPRIDGLIPRSSIPAWWSAVSHIAPAEIETLQVKLRDLLVADTPPSLEAIQQEAHQAAIGWCAAITAELAKSKPDIVLRKLLRGALPQDVDNIGHMLMVAQPLTASMKALTRILGRLNAIEGKLITDLAPDCITLLKQQYQALSESHGMDARFLALAVLDRLAQPRQIMRLGRALSWKPNDTLVASTEFSCIGARLIGDVERLARKLLLQISPRGPLPAADELGVALSHYLTESEGVLSEIGLRRDSPWGIAILKTRTDLADALNADFLDRFAEQALAIMPMIPRKGPNLETAPTRQACQQARDAAGFLKLLVQRGQRHGFAKSALETIESIGESIEERIEFLCEAARQNPGAAPVIEAQARAAAELCEELFDDGRGPGLVRQVTTALRASA